MQFENTMPGIRVVNNRGTVEIASRPCEQHVCATAARLCIEHCAVGVSDSEIIWFATLFISKEASKLQNFVVQKPDARRTAERVPDKDPIRFLNSCVPGSKFWLLISKPELATCLKFRNFCHCLLEFHLDTLVACNLRLRCSICVS